MALQFDEPDPVGDSGNWLKPEDCIGHLLLVWACDYIEHSPTRFTKPGDKADVIVVDVVDLDEADENGYQGALHRKSWWRQARLIGALRRRIGSDNPFLAWMQLGQATMGRPPYELVSATGDKAAVERAQAWARAHPDFAPSFRSNGVPPSPVASAVRTSEPSIIEQRAAVAAGATGDYLTRLAEAGTRGAQRLMPPPPPPPQEDDPPF